MLSFLSSKQEWRRDVKWEPFASLTFTPCMLLKQPSCVVWVVKCCGCVLRIGIWSLAHVASARTVGMTWWSLRNLWRDYTFCSQVGTVLKREVSLGKGQNPPLLWLKDMLMPLANAQVFAVCLDSFHSLPLPLFLMVLQWVFAVSAKTVLISDKVIKSCTGRFSL